MVHSTYDGFLCTGYDTGKNRKTRCITADRPTPTPPPSHHYSHHPPPIETQYYPVEISRTRIVTYVWPTNGIRPSSSPSSIPFLLPIDCFCCLQRWTNIRDKPIRDGSDDEWTFLRQGITHGA